MIDWLIDQENEAENRRIAAVRQQRLEREAEERRRQIQAELEAAAQVDR